MRYRFKCMICGKMTDAYRSPSQAVPKYCSKACFQKDSPKWLYREKYSSLTKEGKAERLLSYYEKNVIRKKGCWDWTTKSEGNKYIRMDYARSERRISAHIYSWNLNFGEVPLGMNVCHHCDNPRCTNPEHLFLGTTQDNIRDKVAKNRHPHGVTHGMSKLDDKKVRRIRDLLEMGVAASRIASDFNLHYCTVYRIKSGKYWKHVK